MDDLLAFGQGSLGRLVLSLVAWSTSADTRRIRRSFYVPYISYHG